MDLVDTHCHLTFSPLSDDLAGVLDRARAAGVRHVVVPAYDPGSWDAVARVAREHAGVHAALGLHPWAADADLDPDDLERRLQEVGAVAIGEIGLDTKIDAPDLERQLAVLRPQLDLARRLDLPVLLHCRGAFETLAHLLAEYDPPLRGILHAFSRGPQLARRFTGLGLHLGIGGAATRTNARRLHRALARVELDSLVLETDAPSIGLADVPPEQVEPAHVADIARSVADAAGRTPGEVAAATTGAARRLLGI